MSRWILVSIITGFCALAVAAPFKEKAAKAAGVEKKNMSFEETLVEGQVYRPELSVVTGDTVLGGLGMLRLRDSFKDRELDDNGEAIP